MTMDLRDVARDLVRDALHAGATAADALVAESDGLEVSVRLGQTETLKRAREKRCGLRVFVGSSTAIVSSADFGRDARAELVRDAVALAHATAPDPHAGLPDAVDLASEVPDLDLYDDAADRLRVPDAIARARTAERAALDASPEITNSDGAEFGGGGGQVAYASSHDFIGAYAGSSFSLSVTALASRDGHMQRDGWWTSNRRLARLDDAEAVGREAARRTLRRLDARRVPTTACPVVFEPETAVTLLRHVASAISGSQLYRRASFLLDRLGEPIASEGVTIVDDPLLPGGPASRPFDGEGVGSQRRTIVEHGVLRSYLLDSYSARRLGLRPTGHAARAAGDAPGVAPTNFHLLAGPHSREAIIASVARGLYVTELMGFGINLVTGDYSRGAAGLWIENGELTHAVEEITIAGNLRDMLPAISMVGSDLVVRGGLAAPTVKVEQLTVAGS
jgi:PmbA protein